MVIIMVLRKSRLLSLNHIAFNVLGYDVLFLRLLFITLIKLFSLNEDNFILKQRYVKSSLQLSLNSENLDLEIKGKHIFAS